MPVLGEIQGTKVPVKLWVPASEVEPGALQQLRNIGSLPWVRYVRAMPDVHLGKGATVGSVIAMKDAVSPNAVGVDIGCGMAAVRTSLRANQLPDSLHALRSAIEAAIPVGNGPRGSRRAGAAGPIFDKVDDIAVASSEVEKVARAQLGTLGGGNHFIEVSLDTDDQVWLMLHSGSRNVGKRIAEHHARIAARLKHNAGLPDRDLAVFLQGTPEMAAYRRDLYWAQSYARANREAMLADLMGVMSTRFPGVAFAEAIHCHHNYVAEEEHMGERLFVTRKGAIRAGKGDLGIVPGSMGTHSFIVRGLGSEESLCSASHGAGRRMSRTQAKREFTTADLEAQTKGVECRKDHGVLDEIPGAYKDVEEVMARQSDLVEIVATLRAVVSVKG